ncbi:MAG: hypothetical protein A2W91_18760 [Bacteroidetes bacterium GWF2_38_335]|nr:MAG: hypothetical protein A2W91_18760 [Bacteroidetes bacterium GWF2_38_335]OFY78223.1 MAG: hypothetical protein A2281_04305 [Bacteroidetes bacterium RIFOXYA12_FULL_38_20]
MYKVFYNDRIVFITDKPLKKDIDKHIFCDKKSLIQVLNVFENSPEKKELQIVHKYPKEIVKVIAGIYTYIEAAGGIVINTKGEFLAIKRLGKWDFPKGKIEVNETPEIAAIREVEEECGIVGPVIKKELDCTFHFYQSGEKRFLKKTFWFEMYYEGTKNLKPQAEEMIEFAGWFKKSALKKIALETYSSLGDLLEKSGYV